MRLDPMIPCYYNVKPLHFQSPRLMDAKLKEVYAAPNPAHGKQEFIRVYENEYHTAGLLLWDAIVAHDSVLYTIDWLIIFYIHTANLANKNRLFYVNITF